MVALGPLLVTEWNLEVQWPALFCQFGRRRLGPRALESRLTGFLSVLSSEMPEIRGLSFCTLPGGFEAITFVGATRLVESAIIVDEVVMLLLDTRCGICKGGRCLSPESPLELLSKAGSFPLFSDGV